MLLPILALFLFFIPALGFLSALGCLFKKRMRPLAPFLFLMPLFSSYGAVFGFFGVAVGLEQLGASSDYTGLGGLVFLLIGGLGGMRIAHSLAKRINKYFQKLAR